MVRVDSEGGSDYLEAELVRGHVFVSYNLGTMDIAVGEPNVLVNDGRYHVVRFTRSGPNSTLQVKGPLNEEDVRRCAKLVRTGA